MDASGGFLVLGLAIILVGVVMVYLSLKAEFSEAKSRGIGLIFIGPIPLVFGGSGRWVLAAIVIGAAIMVLILIGSAEPNMIGW
jgi:uncharacterized membrane protein